MAFFEEATFAYGNVRHKDDQQVEHVTAEHIPNRHVEKAHAAAGKRDDQFRQAGGDGEEDRADQAGLEAEAALFLMLFMFPHTSMRCVMCLRPFPMNVMTRLCRSEPTKRLLRAARL